MHQIAVFNVFFVDRFFERTNSNSITWLFFCSSETSLQFPHLFFWDSFIKNLRILIASFKACLACFPKVLIGGEVGDSWLAASAMEKCGSLGEPPWQ